jgi:signal transduction histidine kinase
MIPSDHTDAAHRSTDRLLQGVLPGGGGPQEPRSAAGSPIDRSVGGAQDPAVCEGCETEAPADLEAGSLAEFSWSQIFATDSFPPRWYCGSWTELQGWVHIVSDATIWFAYLTIPVGLIYFLWRRRDVPFPGLVVLFAGFILLCGLTHALEAAMFWWPAYRFMGLVKAATAIVSMTTAIVLIPLMPKALALKSPGQLEQEVRDRTVELRSNQQELIAAREQALAATRAKSDFLANMSHEIRTPLAAILGFAELMHDDPARADELARVIERNGQHLLHVVNDVLDLSKIEAGKLDVTEEPVDPRAVLDDVVASMRGQAARKTVSLEARCAEDVPFAIVSDPVRLRQILFNLVGNALKFTDVGGVTVTAACVSGGAELEVLVEDTGPGLTEGEAERVFQAFEQVGSATRGGTGLGLTISARLASLLGGRLTIRRTAPGEGTVFALVLPVGSPPASGAVSCQRTNTPLDREALLGRRILVVDDMPDNRLLARKTLEAVKGTVLEAENGQVGLEVLLAMTEHDEAPDLVLVDLGMPVMDGYEMARAARAAGYRGRIVALTAAALSEERDRCLSEGFDGYCTKPIAQRALIRAVVEQIDGTG